MPAVLDRAELEASPLADLHAIADQLGLDGFRRLRKADLIDRIVGDETGDSATGESDADASSSEDGESSSRSGSRRRRGGRSRRGGSSARSESDDAGDTAADEDEDAKPAARSGRGRASKASDTADDDKPASRPRRAGSRNDSDADEAKPAPRSRRGRASSAKEQEPDEQAGDGELVEGVVEVLGNGSAFLRIDPPEPSDGDVYISAAQVRRCELVSGDRVAGPARTPRRSERYPSLVRVEQINGASADAVSAGTRYEDLPVDYPSERFALDVKDPTLEAIEWLTPFGRGSRVLIVGASRAGKSETLRTLLGALSGRDGLELTLVLAGARPEEISQWQAGEPAPAAALSFAASLDTQAQAVERALDAAKRSASRGADAVVLIDSLDALPPHAARKALAAARNLRDGGSLTLIATAAQPFGGESTVIALDVGLTSTGRQPILDLAASGTLRPDLLVGDDGAAAITKARAEAVESAG
ncbi:MAG TPA: Rho termination factor N-terminal domain-containing protein [Solirubrobacteraceae bacterium]|jgi:transcription termination factor Rho|nr:Rho termination factor N-terminal domain-containing protein [Solirubrobacteraceae bacterium]